VRAEGVEADCGGQRGRARETRCRDGLPATGRGGGRLNPLRSPISPAAPPIHAANQPG
jgi:hypothetical protein